MRYTLLVTVCIVITACSNQDIRNDTNQLNKVSTKLKVLSLYHEKIYDLNQKVQMKYGYDSTHLEVFRRFDDTLSLIRDELIFATGGYTQLGEYFNAPALEDVYAYFYGKTNGSKLFFNSLKQFENELSILYPESNFMKELNQRFSILTKMYGLESKEMIFNNLSISEAVMLLESIRSRAALEQTNYLMFGVKE